MVVQLSRNSEIGHRMLKQGKTYIRTRMAVIISVIILAAAVTVAGCKKKPVEQTSTEPAVSSKTSLNNVIRAARTWRPAYTSWYGRTAPDFTLTDLAGKKHKLSDYRGKDVMLVFWAAWCGPCVMEVPHLTALQNIVGKDDLAILAISYLSPRNTTEMVRRFVRQNDRISYTVFSVSPDSMPEPFDGIVYIPCSFFVQPDGKIKLATTGLLTLADMKAILQAE